MVAWVELMCTFQLRHGCSVLGSTEADTTSAVSLSCHFAYYYPMSTENTSMSQAPYESPGRLLSQYHHTPPFLVLALRFIYSSQKVSRTLLVQVRPSSLLLCAFSDH